MSTIPLANIGPSLNRPALICAFFGFGLMAQVVAWVLLGLAGEDALYAVIGPGPAFAALHALTGGTLLPVAIGASFQMLPVLSQRQPPPTRGGWTVFALVAIGQCLQVFGLFQYQSVPLAIGAVSTAVGLVLFIALQVSILRHGDFRHYPETRLGTAIALGFLAVALFVGANMALNYITAFIERPDLAGAIHGLMATYGFMGMLVLAFSPFVLPMVFLAKPPKTEFGRPVVILGALSLVIVIAGIVLESRLILLGGLFLSLIVAGLHILHMEAVLRGRMRRKGHDAAILCRLSWLSFVVSILLAVAGFLGVVGDDWLSAFVVLTYHGWLLSLLIAVIARVLPFLAAMYTVHYCRQPALVTALAPKRLPIVQLGFHISALLLAVAACVLKQVLLLQLAAFLGAVSAILLGAFATTILWRSYSHRRKVGAKDAVTTGSTGYV